LGCFKQAVLVLRWSGTTPCWCNWPRTTRSARRRRRYLHEGINVLAARQPSLHSVLLAATLAGHSHVNLDGTLIYTDRRAAVFKMTFNALRHISLDPGMIGVNVTAALVLLHVEHGRIT
jgi:hypothetical protein